MRRDDARTLITGANGFVGSSLMARLQAEGLRPLGTCRGTSLDRSLVSAPSLQAGNDWSHLLRSVDTVIHAAARVHVMREASSDSLDAFRAVNVEGTLSLARQAAAAGVRRFVFISSVKVNGEETPRTTRFAAGDEPAPEDAYGISKAEAELGLKVVAAETGMEYVIVRPPLVYGPGVKGNFATLMRAVARGLPLPLGAVTGNRRSLVALDNLVDLIVTCIEPPAAANQVFLAGDGEDLSTTELLRRLAAAMGVPVRLLPVPEWALRAGARFAGQERVFQRLCGNLQVDISKAREVLGWVPPISVDEGLRRTVEGFRV